MNPDQLQLMQCGAFFLLGVCAYAAISEFIETRRIRKVLQEYTAAFKETVKERRKR